MENESVKDIPAYSGQSNSKYGSKINAICYFCCCCCWHIYKAHTFLLDDKWLSRDSMGLYVVNFTTETAVFTVGNGIW